MAKRGEAAEATVLAAIKALELAAQPMHYDELAAGMQILGWEHTGKSARPGYAVYGHLYNESSNARRVVFIGKGFFALPGMKEAEGAELRKRRQSANQADAPEDEHEAAAREREDHQLKTMPRICGTCRHLSYRGVNELTQRTGDCAIDDKSGRPYPRSEAEACPYWRPQSPAQRRSQQERQYEVHLLVEAFNAGTERGRRGRQG